MDRTKGVRVILSGEITDEYEGGLISVIDSTQDEFGMEWDRDAVIDVFDTIGYYDKGLNPNDPHLAGWVTMFNRVNALKGTKNVTLTIEENQE